MLITRGEEGGGGGGVRTRPKPKARCPPRTGRECGYHIIGVGRLRYI